MIRLKNLINEAGDFTAKSKESGKLVHFKSKDSYEKAIKAGSHEDPNKDTSKGGDAKSGVNIFNTPSKVQPKSTKIKLGKDADGNMTGDSASSVEAELNKVLGGDGVAEVNYDTGTIEYTIPNKDGDWDAALYIGSDNDGTGKGFAVSIEGNAGGDIGDTYKTFDKQEDAVSYAVKLAQKFKKELGASSKEEPKAEPKKVKFKDFQSDVESSLKANGFSSADLGGLDGVEDFEDSDGNYVSISKGKVFGDDNKFSVMGGKVDDMTDADADTNYQSFNSKEDAIAYAKELAGKLKGGKEEPKKDEPKADPKPQRKGNPQVNKAVRKKASSLGITPAKLGKEEYQTKMAQAAIEALTDSNYHSEARALIAALEGKPEWAEKPTDMPDMSSPKYDEWRKNSVYSSKYYDADNATQELGTSASQESGWDGQDAIDGIAFELRMNGFHKLADKIQSVIKEGKRTSLKNLMK
jgi:hypothetical protein